MKRLLTAWCVMALLSLAAHGAVHRLLVEIEPRFDRAPLSFDLATNVTTQGQQVSVTRLDFLLSNIALRRTNGTWLGLTNWFAYLSMREGRTTFELNNLPAATYDRLRFHVGVPAAINHANPAQFEPTHPLNPNLNGLHWDWQGGYVFFALEGGWQTTNGARSGYSYHVATDRCLMTVELPLELDLTISRELLIALDIAAIFSGLHSIKISDATSSTHSREGDELADRLRQNIERAFSIELISAHPVALKPALPHTGKLEIAASATPYRLSFSRHFPRPALPADNPLTEEGVQLGALLFFDPRLSANNSQSCASCHQPQAAFTDVGKAVSRGAEGQNGTRNSMPLFNLAWKSSFFWDGRVASLREQVLQPITNPVEMHETLEKVVAKLRPARVNARHQTRAFRSLISNPPSSEPDRRKPALRQPEQMVRTFAPPRDNDSTSPSDYPSLFASAFGTAEITADRIARALEQFLLTQVSHHSKFDRFVAGKAELTADEQRGLELFRTEYDPRRGQFGADCFHCHGGPLFQSQGFANNGLDAELGDPGRFLVTGKPGDKGKFAVPSLRNVALTAPYMHDGRFKTLEEVVEHYSIGIKPSATLDPNLAKHPGGGVLLTAADKRALVAFLNTLSDDRQH